MPQFHDLVASVVIDGNPLPEYTIDINEEAKEITCYIPSEAGKEFSVKWKDLRSPRRDTSGSVNLDGTYAGLRCIFERSGCGEAKRSYFRTTQTTVQPFRFVPIPLTEDETDIAPNQLGEVRLTLSLLLKWKVGTVSHPMFWKAPREVKIHERSKKALTHCVGHGEDTTRISGEIISGIKCGDRLATFIFRYRALDFLQAHGIAPSAPQCKRQSKKRAAAEQDVIYIKEDDEGDDNEQRLEMLKTEIKRIEARRLKRQKMTIKAESKPVIIKNEVIELT